MTQNHDITSYDNLERFYGGPRGMQAKFGLSQPGIACWKIRGIPTGYHLRIFLELQMSGLSIDPDLFEADTTLATFMDACGGRAPAASKPAE